MSRSLRFVFTGGGTGGHVSPNLAIIEELHKLEPDAVCLYLGLRHGAEATMVPKRGIPLVAIRARPFVSPRRPLAFARFTLALVLGVLKSLFVLIRQRPAAVVATGGYVSVPPVIAAWLLRRPIYLHEQNVRPGRANRLLARLATRVAVSFEETRGLMPVAADRVVVAGYPVRPGLAAGDDGEVRRRLGIPEDHRVAFFVGGSMGSRSINRATVDGIARLLEDEKITVIHSTGLMERGGYHAWEDTESRLERVQLPDASRGRYIRRRFFEDIESAYRASDLVVTRAGAGAIMELAALGKPALLIPKCDGPDGHQLDNALSVEDRGAAELILEESYEESGQRIARVHGDQLARRVKELLADRERLDGMARSIRNLVVPDAAKGNARAVLDLARPAPETRRESSQQLVGYFTDANGQETELIFDLSTIGHGSTSDLVLLERGRRERALVRRVGRSREDTTHLLIPRRGEIRVDGEPIRRETRLLPGQVVEIGPNRLVFDARLRNIEMRHRRGGILGRIVSTGLGTMLSRAFGLVRTLVLGRTFGASVVMDVFAASLTISNLFRRVFAENAVDSAFLPSYLTLERSGRREAARRLTRTVLTVSIVLTSVVTVLGILTVPIWLPWMLPGFAEKGLLDDAVTLTRWMMPYLVLVTIAAVFSAILRAHNRFAVPAWSSLFYSVGVVAGVGLYPVFGIAGLGVGVLLGGVGQVAAHLPTLLSKTFRRRHEIDLRPLAALSEPGMKKVRAAAPKIFGDVVIGKAGSVIDVMIVSTLAIGDPAVLFFALILFQLPFALVPQSINTVALKEFSEWQAVRDRDFCRRLVVSGINWNVFLLLPISALMVVLALPSVELVLEYRNFGPDESRRVAAALAAYAIGLVGWGLQGLTGRFYAARLEVGQAMLINLGATLLNVALSLFFVYATDLSFVGVALGTSIAYLVNGVFRVWHLNRNLARDGAGFRLADLAPSLQAATLATMASALIAWFSYEVVRDFALLPTLASRLISFGAPVVAGGITYFVTAAFLRAPETDEIMARLARFFPRPTPGARPRRAVNLYTLTPGRLYQVALNDAELVKTADRRPLTRITREALAKKDWREVNVGVKLAGVLGLKSLRPDLSAIVRDRRPAPLGHRFFGGDFRHPGFVRRNAVYALRQIGEPDEEVEGALLVALEDPYFEVRSAAARAIEAMAPRLSPTARHEAIAILRRLVRDRNFEVAMYAVRALQAVALDASIMDVLGDLHYHANWQVRHQVVRAYYELYRRGIVEDRALLLRRLDDVLVTSESFKPQFELKATMASVRKGLSDEDETREGER
ncbi:MAG: murein biosynthesis integral membrane protein MurJ [Planctomycetota bacterium]